MRARLAPRAALPRDEPVGDSARVGAAAHEDASSEGESPSPSSAFARRVAAGATAFAACAALSLAPPGGAIASLAKDLVDPRAVESGKCLLSRCQLELAECLVDEKCAESLVCLNTCFGQPDEADCQIKCGDLYASKAVQTFNTCAITTNDCVKQKQDTGEYPAPPLDAMASGFDATVFGEERRWYIVAGVNRASRLIIEECLKWSKQRMVFGKPLAEQPVIRQKLAKLASQVEGVQAWLEAITYQMQHMSHAEQAARLAGPIALLKLFATRVANDVSDEACQIFGGRAITATGMGQVVERFQRSVKFGAILGGSEEIMGDLGIRQAMRGMPNARL